MLDQLSADDRLLLLRFVCAFAWTDLEVTGSERRFVARLVERLELGEVDRRQVAEWLTVAPAPGDLSPASIPTEHRRSFVEAIRALIYSDGEVDAEEREQFEKLKSSLGL